MTKEGLPNNVFVPKTAADQKILKEMFGSENVANYGEELDFKEEASYEGEGDFEEAFSNENQESEGKEDDKGKEEYSETYGESTE